MRCYKVRDVWDGRSKENRAATKAADQLHLYRSSFAAKADFIKNSFN